MIKRTRKKGEENEEEDQNDDNDSGVTSVYLKTCRIRTKCYLTEIRKFQNQARMREREAMQDQTQGSTSERTMVSLSPLFCFLVISTRRWQVRMILFVRSYFCLCLSAL